jgi:hypothetical protein
LENFLKNKTKKNKLISKGLKVNLKTKKISNSNQSMKESNSITKNKIKGLMKNKTNINV